MGSERLGWPFAPSVAYLYNGSATAINAGEAVCLLNSSGLHLTTAIDWPEPEFGGGCRQQVYTGQNRAWGTTLRVPTVGRIGGAPTANQGVLGISMEYATASSWLHVCIGGVCDVRVTTAQNLVSVGEPLKLAASGMFIRASAGLYTSALEVRAIALEACQTSAGTDVVTIAMIRALFIPDDGRSCYYFHTA
jgi:hypothetical protein